jgi:2-polyprenyl-3-methyl-5-hydroxy-6-metoxy-1,4-benzoquinol methylase
MPTDALSDAKIIEAWGKNALPWIAAVREGRIESRQRVTDQAIVDAILNRAPRSVLDVGCGEGWLARALARHHIGVTGIDTVPALIEAAREAGGGDFHLMSYEDIAAGNLGISVDTLVCNF